MRINDEHREINQIMRDLVKAVNDNDQEKFQQLYAESLEAAKADVAEKIRKENREAVEAADQEVLRARGANVLTSEETQYYTKLGEAFASSNPKQALANLNLTMPETIINRVAEDLRTDHPLLRAIRFQPTGANIRTIINTNGQQKAVWGQLCDEIVKELAGGFQVVNTSLLKLSAFLPVCKQGFKFTNGWLDAYVRATLYEAAANGLEEGIVAGTGKDEPIGMKRKVGPGTTVVDGVYPLKELVEVGDLDLATVGSLVALVAKDENGKTRKVRDLLLVVNEVDYYVRVLPAIMMLTPDGSYRSTLPYPMTIVPVANGLDEGEAVFGLGYRYFAAIGQESEDGIIDYSDHAWFLKDQRLYIIKAFANGFPMDGNAFLRLDISKLKPARYIVQTSENTPSSNSALTELSLGAAALSPAFAAATTTYTAATTNATNVIKAVPAEADAEIEVKLGNDVVPNGSALTWAAGENVVTVKVTAADGSAYTTYTITVTKS